MPNSNPHLPEVLQQQLDATAANNEILTDLRVSVGRLMTQQDAETKASVEWRHAMRNMIAGFVPRNELVERFRGIDDRFRASEDRVKDLEESQKWAARRVITAWIGLAGAAATAVAHKLNLL